MQGNITLNITVEDSSILLKPFEHSGFIWIKPGDAWDDYEPGYISEKHHLIWAKDFDNFISDCINGLILHMYNDYMKLPPFIAALPTRDKSICVNYEYIIPSGKTLTFLPDDLARLSQICSLLSIHPCVDYYITESDDGKNIVARMETVICDREEGPIDSNMAQQGDEPEPTLPDR